MTTKCPCESGKSFSRCCEPYLKGEAWPPSPEALMRSRYTAYTQVAVDYLHATLAPESRADFDAATTRTWAKNSAWHGLKIVAAKDDMVEFVASYEQEGTLMHHHERSRFRQDDKGHWLFVDGQVNPDAPAQKPLLREAPKVGRNDPCPCGSGQKFKKCCG